MKRVFQNMEEQIFGSSQEDMFAIYQLKEEAIDISFMGTKMLERAGRKVDKDNYELVYASPLYPELTLDMIYGMFNSDCERPADFYGHSLSVSDIILMRRNQLTEAWFVEPFGFKNVTLSFWQPYMYAVAVADRFLSLVDCEDGFDYSIYDGKTFNLIDGGIYDDEEVTIDEAFKEILGDMVNDKVNHPLVCSYSKPVQVNFDILDDFANEADCIKRGEKEPLTVEELFKRRTELFFHPIDGGDSRFIEDSAWAYILSKKDVDGLDIKIKNLAICGSRCRGLEVPDSDIDIVFEYEGDYSEDYLYNNYNSDGFSACGIKMDFNPIKAGKSGILVEFLCRAEDFLSEKRLLAEIKEAFPLKSIASRLKEMGYEAKVEYVQKDTGSYHGISICKKEELSAPVFRYENILEKDKKEAWTLDKIAEACVEFYNENIPKKSIQSMLMDREYVLANTKICLQPVSNNDFVKRSIEHMEGIEAYLRVYLEVDDENMASAIIKEFNLKFLNISHDEIWSSAERNTFEGTIIAHMPFESMFPMHIVSNNLLYRGAACILDRDKIREFSKEMGYCGRYVVIPSSIHEMLIIPKEYAEESGICINDEMIKEINASFLSPGEWLGEQAFEIDVREEYKLK